MLLQCEELLWLSRYSDSLQAGRSGDRIPVGASFSAQVQTGPGAHPASYTMGTGSFLGVKRPGRGVDHPPHLVPKLRKEQSCNSTPTLGFVGYYRVSFTFTFTLFMGDDRRMCLGCRLDGPRNRGAKRSDLGPSSLLFSGCRRRFPRG
jgi:hypothetical protein